MLVLGRHTGESILVGDNIVVTLVRIGRDSCRIGITAPKDMNIVRSELVHPELLLPDDDGEDEEVDADMGGEGGGNR